MTNELAQGFRIGIDVVLIPRISLSLSRHGHAFLKKFLTGGEILYCLGKRQNPWEANVPARIAGRIAAKEAVMKVLGEGWPKISWTDIEISPDEKGRPCVLLTGKALSIARTLHVDQVQVSITHDGDLALAVAVAVPTGSIDEDLGGMSHVGGHHQPDEAN